MLIKYLFKGLLTGLLALLLGACEQGFDTPSAATTVTLHMVNGDVLQGRLGASHSQLGVQTPYGVVNFPVEQLATVTKIAPQQDSDRQHQMVLQTRDGSRFSGVFTLPEITVEQSDGNTLSVASQQLDKLVVRTADAAAPRPQSAFQDAVVMRNADLFTATITTPEFIVATGYAELKLMAPTVERLDFMGEPDSSVKAVLKDNQGVVSGRLLTPEIELQTRAGQTLKLAASEFKTIAIAVTAPTLSALGQQMAAESQRDTEEPAAATIVQDTFADGSPGPELVVIPRGAFTMGSPEDEPGRHQDEQLHEVTVTRPVAVAKYEVTFADYDRFAAATGREKPYDQDWGRGQLPVINISAHDATAYAAWLSEQTGQSYRLLTEAEWEYVARAGTTTAYWWGDEIGVDNAVCKTCLSTPAGTEHTTQPVGSLAANPFGLYDISGNVWEWTCSRYARIYNGWELQCAAANDEELRAIRGGAYLNPPAAVRSAARDSFSPADSNELVGFRLAREL